MVEHSAVNRGVVGSSLLGELFALKTSAKDGEEERNRKKRTKTEIRNKAPWSSG